MKALVTGATGFVGAHLVRALRSSGWTVRALVRSSRKAAEDLADAAELVEGDLTDRASLAGIGSGVDAVFHAAAQLNLPGVSWEDYLATNLGGTQNLVEALRTASIRRFVQVSSIAAIGIRGVGEIDESFPCNPDLPYGMSKLRVDEYLLGEFGRSGFPVVIVRPPTVYLLVQVGIASISAGSAI
jgi:nucleoside-diphosphate-sugar epimerase